METIKENEIVLYQPNETIKLEVRVENDSVWLNQIQMSVLFGTGRQAITKHIKNIYACGELQKEATCSILELVRLEGSRNVTRQIEFYNLDVIISVGYRVNTKTNRIQRLPYLKGTHTIGFLTAKLQLFRELARG